jgi:glycosyltransferase involved in cell wall biosynthesis
VTINNGCETNRKIHIKGNYLNANYILITPAKNEQSSLPALIESIAVQINQPVIWVIVDDNSQDNTTEILERARIRYPWIIVLTLKEQHEYDLGRYYSTICIKGFNFAFEYCKNNGINYDFIALSDADMIYPPNYYSECISSLVNNVRLGIVSGKIFIKTHEGEIQQDRQLKIGTGEPTGTGRVWKKEAFIETGGYILTQAADCVSNAMAVMKGWNIARLNYLICYQTRDMGAKYSLWRGSINEGKRAYYINSNPLRIFNGIIASILFLRSKKAVIKSIGVTCGYITCCLRRQEKISNNDVKRYMGSYKRIFANYWLFLKGFKTNK